MRDNVCVSNPHLRQAKARLGERAGKFTLDSLIDIGGMAAVYRAKRWRTVVAVKVLHRAYCRLPEAVDRFARESLAANRIAHTDVVKVLDHGELDDGTPFFTMELLEGCSLEQRLEQRPTLPEEEVVTIAERVADVLDVAHAAGVVHRDIKPGNIFLTTLGDVKVLDFGLARLLDGSAHSMTRTGTVIGTASYMSAEQALRDPKLIDPRTDLWSLGAVMFRALTGRTVHNQSGQGPALIAAATQKAPPLAEIAEDVHPQLGAIVDVALAFKKDHRFDDAGSMKAALAALREDTDPMAWDALPPPAFEQVSAEHISVTVESSASGDSILVSFDDDEGDSQSVALAPREDDDGYEVIVIDETFDPEN